MAKADWNQKHLDHIHRPGKTHLTSQEMKNYVYFSSATKGHAGKVVKIKIDLFPRFAALVDPKSYNGQTVVRQIENLRMANGASAGSLGNINSAFKFMFKARNMDVFYAILDGGENGKKEVYITDIRANFGADDKAPGLYGLNSWTRKFDKLTELDLHDKVVFLNGQTENWGRAMLSAKKHCFASEQNLALFYSPNSVINALGVWHTSGSNQAAKDAAGQLQKLIQKNAKKRVVWVAEGEGAGVFADALDGVTGSLAAHKVRLIDPVGDTPALLQKLKTKESRPPVGEVAPVTFTGTNRAATILMDAHKQALINELKNLKVRGDGEYLHDEMVAQLESSGGGSALNQNKQALSSTAALNQRVLHKAQPVVAANRAALSFIDALKRV